ncbi:DUF1853 family protein [Pseudoduganella albidiflava]|uniref:DUF1853 family protein n=1 Tax=Pseudoduganella albidiflava TaxID=321983 RepID=A0A411X0K9_9BURK|nr:DUF1853 family protein [Pseudoduganella albidiflava]QBI02490.1 DUF1853 family protein [Pseudoduganella albidiflava]GGY42366.1 hypothetical protein GCM10007387_25430 [Pseudoduganella albidiflava]
MPAAAESAKGATYQARFERRWRHLTRPHVRALAWLLDAPDLLDANAPYWHGRIAAPGPVAPEVEAWLAALEADPAPLEAALGGRFYSRLGLYAEKLMAFYFAQRGTLAAHGLQVRTNHHGIKGNGGKETVGEFDFLLDEAGGGLRHIEFATKFYLLDSDVATTDFDLLVGPNLGDTLGRKMRKIFDQQLALAQHPAAQQVLPRPVTAAQALVKGWLFYPPGAVDGEVPVIPGITADHCRGRWLTLAGLAGEAGHAQERFVVMPRLQWLAPLKARVGDALPAVPAPLARGELAVLLATKFEADASPVMVATIREEDGWLLEESRAFVVRDDWPARAAIRRQTGQKPG